jgi:hypothetical protein
LAGIFRFAILGGIDYPTASVGAFFFILPLACLPCSAVPRFPLVVEPHHRHDQLGHLPTRDLIEKPLLLDHRLLLSFDGTRIAYFTPRSFVDPKLGKGRVHLYASEGELRHPAKKRTVSGK